MFATAAAPPVCNKSPQVKIKQLFRDPASFLSKTLSKWSTAILQGVTASVLEPRCCTNDVVGGAQCLRDGSARLVLPRNCVDSLEEE